MYTFLFICFCRPMKQMAWDGPKWGQKDFFTANPDLADILGRTDLDFKNFKFFICWIPNFWISRSPDFQNLAGPGMDIGSACAAIFRSNFGFFALLAHVLNKLGAGNCWNPHGIHSNKFGLMLICRLHFSKVAQLRSY